MLLNLFWLVLFLLFAFRFIKAALHQQPIGADAMGDHGNVITINSVAEWDAKLDEAHKAKKVIVVDFTATWCGPCRHMAPIFVELSKKHTDLIYLKVDVDQLQDIAGKWDVQAMPTFIFIKDKQLAHKIVGANREELEKKSAFFSPSPRTS